VIYKIKKVSYQYLAVIKEIEALRTTLKFATSDSLNRWTRLLVRTTAARVIVGTNAMEGVNVTTDDAIAAIDGEQSLSQAEEDRHAIQGYLSAMTYIVQLSRDDSYAHNEGTIKSLHFMLCSHDLTVNPGRYRPGAVHVSNMATGDIVYQGADVALVPGLMLELVDSLNEDSVQHQIVRAAMAHLNLTMIHPFRDGNGRMARALQTMVLSRDGILDPEFSSIEEYIGRHSADYYKVLADVGQGSWHPEHDALPWLKFALTAHYRQATDLLRRTTDINRLWNELERLAKARKINERTVNALASAALGYKVKNTSYQQQAGVGDQIAKYDLKILADAGLLVPHGEKRGRYYSAGPAVKEVRDATRTPRIEIDPFAEPEAQQSTLPGFADPD
jgi:Fic family protein